jgi:hypothetical protein
MKISPMIVDGPDLPSLYRTSMEAESLFFSLDVTRGFSEVGDLFRNADMRC